MIEFDNAQREALNKLNNGKILCGDVGSGKSRTSLAYYFVKECHGQFEPNYISMQIKKHLYIITTAKKRDSKEWIDEYVIFGIPDSLVTIDSWNNIKRYIDVKDSFFIFDEQRLVGSGAWVKAFYKIVKSNRWILLSATPGDTWSDYIPVFVANGFYKNKTEFLNRHAVYDRYSKFPKIDKYLEERKLSRLRDSLLVDIAVTKQTQRHYIDVTVDYDSVAFKNVMKTRWNIFEDKPIKDASQYCYILRKISNLNEHRLEAVLELMKQHKRVIIFYNFDYELDILKKCMESNKIEHREWNGHKHEPLPGTNRWAYLVQYTAGAEGWNCTTTDTIIFFSFNYSYKCTMQAAGRIDRRNTPYKDLYYYYIKTNSWIDRAIKKALNSKKNFNESRYFKCNKCNNPA